MKRASQKKRTLYDNGSSSDEEEDTRVACSRPGVFSSLLLGTNIITGVQRADTVETLKRMRDYDDGSSSDDMLTQTAKSQRANRERRNAEAKLALERQESMQTHNPPSSMVMNGGATNSNSSSSSTSSSRSKITFDESIARAKTDPAPAHSKRISYAEMEQLARQERLEELASFTALSQAPTQRAARESQPVAAGDDSEDDEWMDKAEVVEHAEQANAAQQTQAKRKNQISRQSGLSGHAVAKAGGGKSNADKAVKLPAAALDLPPDAQDDEGDGSEHPSCELKDGCQRRGPLQLAAFDAAAAALSKQKGIVGKDLIIQAMPASEVNQACASRLLPHQVIGVQWLWRKYALGQGAILGDGKRWVCACEWLVVACPVLLSNADNFSLFVSILAIPTDMGMGKTIQVIALLLAIFCKHGNNRDLRENRRRRGLKSAAGFPPPCLVVAPSSVVANWGNELRTWGHFMFKCCHGKESVEQALEELRNGHLEVLVIGYSQMTINVSGLASVTWSAVFFDEGHGLMNRKTNKYLAALKIGKNNCCRSRMTLTGTPIQNNMEELWAILNLITQERFQTLDNFKEHFSAPIRNAMSTKYEMAPAIIQRGNERQQELYSMMECYMLKRKKESLEGEHKLKGKSEWVVLSDLTLLQRKLYAHVMSLPDFENARYAKHPCPCMSGNMRKECCDKYVRPLTRGVEFPDLDPRAALWHHMHPDGTSCTKCPSCISLPVQNKLRCIYNDPALLQAPSAAAVNYDALLHAEHDTGLDTSDAIRNAINQDIAKAQAVSSDALKSSADFLRISMPPELLMDLGGVCREQEQQLFKKAEQRSGKMSDLSILLQRFRDEGHRTLVFSESTKVLDLIEIQLKFGGWTFLRLDGSTTVKARAGLVDDFNRNNTIEVFLISSKAGGMGLNLTSATRVVHFDVNWNPTVDQQAQDRAYRIGQDQPVSTNAAHTLLLVYMHTSYLFLLTFPLVASGSAPLG